MNQTCPGCGRNELHKMCPAHGTPYYMSGEVFTEEMEKKLKDGALRPFSSALIHQKMVRIPTGYYPEETDVLNDMPFKNGESVEVLWPDRHQSIEKVAVERSPAGHQAAFVMIDIGHGVSVPLRVLDPRIKLRRLNG